MKAYLINLDSAGDRLAQFDDQARTLGFDYQRIPAIDGRTPEYADRIGTRPVGPLMGLALSPAEVACFESHRAAWRAIIASGDDHGMVLEDDVILKTGFERYVAPGWVPPGIDIVRLESWLKPLHLDRAKSHAVHGRRIYRLRSSMAGGAAYVLSAASARYLLDQTGRIEDPVDIVLFDAASPVFKALTIYQMAPSPARQAQLVAGYQTRDFAQSALSSSRSFDQPMIDMTRRPPWWRPFRDVPGLTFKEACAMAVWVAKERLKGLLKGTHFKFVRFE